MDLSHINLTTPIVVSKSTLWFSAYAFGWGYHAFRLGPAVVREYLGAADDSPTQLLLAFELSKQRLVGAAERKISPDSGERIEMTGTDL
ncbi:hypothetical protein [Paraburkholderia aspalathi]|uniref:Uncharacterized protein n=1 Tax=Paraburkholderia aspalathi TaxID=1324617 RepID=A0A1I7BDV2_9BURK|nr:hypothetical protein [Paraburkholderia aspalathi]SFT85406.1 hypothetical protein SAMN05192563_1004390 [Paraburkholderia aspalathi]